MAANYFWGDTPQELSGPDIPTDWGAFAGEDDDYRIWLEKVDQLCLRFLDVQIDALISSREIDPSDDYFAGISPELFVKSCVVPYLEFEHGAEMIYELIAQQVMWGSIPYTE